MTETNLTGINVTDNGVTEINVTGINVTDNNVIEIHLRKNATYTVTELLLSV